MRIYLINICARHWEVEQMLAVEVSADKSSDKATRHQQCHSKRVVTHTTDFIRAWSVGRGGQSSGHNHAWPRAGDTIWQHVPSFRWQVHVQGAFTRWTITALCRQSLVGRQSLIGGQPCKSTALQIHSVHDHPPTQLLSCWAKPWLNSL